MAEKIKREAGKTHKDRVHEFNAKLESLSEHHDIPKVRSFDLLCSKRMLTLSFRSGQDNTHFVPQLYTRIYILYRTNCFAMPYRFPYVHKAQERV